MWRRLKDPNLENWEVICFAGWWCESVYFQLSMNTWTILTTFIPSCIIFVMQILYRDWLYITSTIPLKLLWYWILYWKLNSFRCCRLLLELKRKRSRTGRKCSQRWFLLDAVFGGLCWYISCRCTMRSPQTCRSKWRTWRNMWRCTKTNTHWRYSFLFLCRSSAADHSI